MAEVAPAIVGRRACARPAGCCISGPPATWCAALCAGLTNAPDEPPALATPLPRLHARVATARGPGRVARVQVARALVTVALDATGALVELPAAALRPLAAG
jgi:hypothetical protein